MKDTKLISFSIILLSLSIAFSGFWIGVKLDNRTKTIPASTTATSEQEHPLMTMEETASYLRIPVSKLEDMIIQQTKLRGALLARMIIYLILGLMEINIL